MRAEVVDDVFIRVAGAGERVVWMIHALGDSGRSFEPLFATPLATNFTIVVPDLPGCGVSAPRRETASLRGMAQHVAELIHRRTPNVPVSIVGHSLGSAIATLTTACANNPIRAIAAIEGNLTATDAYFSGRAAQYDDAETFKRDLCTLIWKKACEESAESESMRRYFASLVFADAQTLWQIGRDTFAASHNHGLGAAYRELSCPTLYCWSEKSTPEETQRYVQEFAITNRRLTHSGHWPMIDSPRETAQILSSCLMQHWV